MLSTRRTPGYIPSSRQLRLKRFETSSYSARHRHGIVHHLRRRLRRYARMLLVDALRSLRSLNRSLMSLRASMPVARPRIAVQARTVPTRNVDRVSVDNVYGVLRTLKASRRETTPGRHRLEGLNVLDNRAYLTWKEARRANRYAAV